MVVVFAGLVMVVIVFVKSESELEVLVSLLLSSVEQSWD